MPRTIIAVSGPRNAGKTTSIRLAYDQLSQVGEILDSGLSARTEVRAAILKLEGAKVGFVSPGDLEHELRKNLKRLIEAGCHVIVCATHTSRSGTYRAVHELRAEYKTIWLEKERAASSAEAVRENQETANDIIRQVAAAVGNARGCMIDSADTEWPEDTSESLDYAELNPTSEECQLAEAAHSPLTWRQRCGQRHTDGG